MKSTMKSTEKSTLSIFREVLTDLDLFPSSESLRFSFNMFFCGNLATETPFVSPEADHFHAKALIDGVKKALKTPDDAFERRFYQYLFQWDHIKEANPSSAQKLPYQPFDPLQSTCGDNVFSNWLNSTTNKSNYMNGNLPLPKSLQDKYFESEGFRNGYVSDLACLLQYLAMTRKSFKGTIINPEPVRISGEYFEYISLSPAFLKQLNAALIGEKLTKTPVNNFLELADLIFNHIVLLIRNYAPISEYEIRKFREDAKKKIQKQSVHERGNEFEIYNNRIRIYAYNTIDYLHVLETNAGTNAYAADELGTIYCNGLRQANPGSSLSISIPVDYRKAAQIFAYAVESPITIKNTLWNTGYILEHEVSAYSTHAIYLKAVTAFETSPKPETVDDLYSLKADPISKTDLKTAKGRTALAIQNLKFACCWYSLCGADFGPALTNLGHMYLKAALAVAGSDSQKAIHLFRTALEYFKRSEKNGWFYGASMLGQLADSRYNKEYQPLLSLVPPTANSQKMVSLARSKYKVGSDLNNPWAMVRLATLLFDTSTDLERSRELLEKAAYQYRYSKAYTELANRFISDPEEKEQLLDLARYYGHFTNI